MSTLTLSETESLCPVCLQRIPAFATVHDDGIYLEKACPDHGAFETIIWRGTQEEYESWIACSGRPGTFCPSGPHVGNEAGCPFCCGLCEDHEGETFTAALMVTSRCNLSCPLCFTRCAKTAPDPTIEELTERLAFYLETSGAPFPLELCGGEPTVREDLCDIAATARDMGFAHIQLNTNGIRIAQDPTLATRLVQSGVTTAYLSFDGIDGAYEETCGQPLLDLKKRAVERLGEAGIGIVLVPVLASGINLDQVGEIIRFAKTHMPFVRGVNFQPMGRLGFMSETLANTERITLPDVLRAIEDQTAGELRMLDFMPGGVEHALCSFQALYMRKANGTLHPLSKRKTREGNDCAAKHVRETVPVQWHASPMPVLTVGGMLFQDAHNVDVARLKRCPTHVIGDGKLYPLCAKYLTSDAMDKLYEGID